MAAIRACNVLLLLFTVILAATYLVEGSGNKPAVPSVRRVLYSSSFQRQQDRNWNQEEKRIKTMKRWRRMMIGSTAPNCTYNECRGCKYRCRAEQVPVEGNDPINSAYHYRCVCHR